ncbi:hypothetical protein KR009_003923 [Drosophila setifemur]|nr:hypothetical protein KR009_003923 [Drosophila setifemur]
MDLCIVSFFISLVLSLLTGLALGSLNCLNNKSHPLHFHLVRQCQRASADDAVALENVSSLEECANLARELRGLALNYAPGDPKRSKNIFETSQFGNETKNKAIRSRLTVFEQPGEFFNCHVLQCPQNSSFSGMVNDSRFDYYSLYGRPTGWYPRNSEYIILHFGVHSTVMRNYSCVPEVGLFVVFTQPSSYLNASLTCSNASEFTGSLAHIASESRTTLLAHWLLEYNRMILGKADPQPNVFLAYVGLVYNRSSSLNPLDFRNSQQESLHCFLYRAWDVGHPRLGWELVNASCVSLTSRGSWYTLNCDRALPFICEIHTAKPSTSLGQTDSELDIGPNAVLECGNSN